ncbi:hypothetical protein B0T22DRAFT_474711, partial [Podospora appendiculata]
VHCHTTTYSILEDALPLRNPARNTMLAAPTRPQEGRDSSKFHSVTPEILKMKYPALDPGKAEATLLVMGKAVKSVISGLKNTGSLSFKGRAVAQDAPCPRPKIIDNSDQPAADMTFEQDVNMCVVSRGTVETNGINFEDMLMMTVIATT